MKQKKFYRDPERGKLGGVCAGIANYFGWELWVVRIIAVTALVLMSKFTLIAYIAMWIVVDKKPATAANRIVKETTTTEHTADGRAIEVKTRVWEAGAPPKQALKDIQVRFDQMEGSIRDMESYVTSSEYKVRQEFNRL